MSKFNEEERTLNEYALSLKGRVKTLVKREKSCAEMESIVEARFEMLSAQEGACAKREGEINSQVKDVAARIKVVAWREGLCSRRELEVGDQLRSISDREEELAKQGRRLDARTEGVAEREERCGQRELEVTEASEKLEDELAMPLRSSAFYRCLNTSSRRCLRCWTTRPLLWRECPKRRRGSSWKMVDGPADASPREGAGGGNLPCHGDVRPLLSP